MKSLGVIGGLGPMATAYFLELIVKMTDASCDQEHLEVTVLNRPAIPDRTACILGQSCESPVPMMTEAAKTLEMLGASCIAVPCITSHYFFDELQKQVSIPFINLVQETAAHLKENGIQTAGILATSGTVSTGLFQKALEREGIRWVIPDEAGQEMVMHLIYQNIKAGLPPEMPLFAEVRENLRQKGAECMILGCTELSLIKKQYPNERDCLDALEVLAKRSVEFCGKPLRKEYRSLISR